MMAGTYPRERFLMQVYAHSKPAPQTGLPLPTDHWQPLDEHLQNVANLAADFAKPFGGEAWARAAGLLHDVGKGTLPWQAYLRKANQIVDELAKHFQGRVDHKHVGAREAVELAEQAGKLLAYCIAGHHGGMPNWDDTEEWALRSKLNDQQPPFERVTGTPAMPERLPIILDPKRCGFQIQFFARMLFSCLVDADYLDTARAMGGASPSVQPELVDLIETFWANFNALRETADPALEVNREREAVLRDCLASAPMAPGLFSLTVPTGGGKTFASLAFALEHARKHGKRRVIYVIPFTSIIEQNAAEFRKTARSRRPISMRRAVSVAWPRSEISWPSRTRALSPRSTSSISGEEASPTVTSSITPASATDWSPAMAHRSRDDDEPTATPASSSRTPTSAFLASMHAQHVDRTSFLHFTFPALPKIRDQHRISSFYSGNSTW